MRILFSYGLVGRGGDAVQVLSLAKTFRRLGYEIETVGACQLRPYEFTTVASSLRTLLRQWPWWIKDSLEIGMSFRLLARVRRLLRRRMFDIVLHRAGIYDILGSWLPRELHGRLIVFLDAPFGVERYFHKQSYLVWLHRRCMQQLGRQANLIVTVSSASRTYYAQIGMPEEKILVLPNGVSEELLHRGTELAGAYPPFAQVPTCTVGFSGSLSRWHRVDLLLEALRMLRAEPDWRLRIVGYGEEYARLRRTSKGWGLEQNIEWLGALPHERAFDEIASCDIAVLPHTLPTGAPMKLMEYAALARPTIAPDLPNLRDLFNKSEMLFVKPESPEALAKALQALRRDPTMARRLGEQARERVKTYTWERTVARLMESIH